MRGGLLLRRAAVAAYCVLIFYLSSRSDYPTVLPWYPKWMPDSHLIAHFSIYFGLGFLAFNDFRREQMTFLKRNAMVMSVVFCALYGLSDETHQLFVPGRLFEVADLAMDTAGGACGAVALLALGRAMKKPSAKIASIARAHALFK